MLKKCLTFLILLFVVAGVGKLWHLAKDGFSIQRTSFFFLSALPKPSPLDPSLREALSQTYTYLARGHQCYAFASADGKYVLKLPRFDRYEIPFWLRSTPFSHHRESMRRDRERRSRFLFCSFQIASEELKSETALLYLHLGKGEGICQEMKIVDRLGRSYFLDLDQTAFILQEKRPLLMPLLLQSLKWGKRQRAEEMLNSFLDIVALRARKGIFNKDPSFLRNFAFDGERAIQIDIGSFYRKAYQEASPSFALSFRETVSHVQEWLKGVDPELSSWFNGRIDSIVDEEKKCAS